MEQKSVNGRLDISVDETRLNVFASIAPVAKGDTISADTVRTKLRSAGIRVNPDAAAIDRLLARAADSVSPVSLCVASGQPPDTSVAPAFEWVPRDIPDDLVPDAEAIYRNAPVPEIFRPVPGSTKKETDINGSGGLFSRKNHDNRKHDSESPEQGIPVSVDPHIVSRGFVRAGTRIAAIKPGKTGKSGKDVYGGIILPDESEPVFFIGSGIETVRSELKAKVTGFFRRGKNWADILPFEKHKWEVYMSRDKNSCLLDFTPGNTCGLPPSPDDVRKKAESLGYDGNLLMSSNEIRNIFTLAMHNGETLNGVAISTSEDSYFTIEVSQDKLKGILTVRKHRGNGKPLVLRDVGDGIKASGLKGLNFEKIKNDILDFYRGSASLLDGYVLCEGKGPGEGTRQALELDVAFLAAREKNALLAAIEEAGPACMNGISSLEDFPVASVKDFSRVIKEQRIAYIEPAKKGENGIDVFGAPVPGNTGDELDIHLYENVRLEKNGIVASIDGILDYFNGGDKSCFRVRPHRDAVVDVSVSDDRMTVFLTLCKEEGAGIMLSRARIDDAITAAKITHGLDDAAISDAFLRAGSGEDVTNVVIARGKAPYSPGEGTLEFRINLASGKGVSIDKSGRADFRRQDKITTVDKDTLIAEFVGLHENAEDGWDVFGKVLPAREIKSGVLTVGANIEEKTLEDGTRQFFSTIRGEVSFEKKKLEVRSVYTLAGDVDMKSGNIKFPGDVRIAGNVTTGFVVFSGGNIHVLQSVDAALLSSEESIIITGGVKGGGKAVIRSKNEIQAAFAEQANMLAIGNIILTNACLRCNIKTNGLLILSGEKGSFMGGSVKARQGLKVQNLGSCKGIKTVVSFGQNYLVQDQIEVEDRELRKHKDDMLKIDSMMERLEAAGNRAALDAARREKLTFMKLIEKRSMRLFTLREKFEEHFPSVVEVRGTLYPGVVFESHGRYHEIDCEKKAVKIRFDQKTGRIIEQTLGEERKEKTG